jgi:hypothetical protein
MFDLEKKEVAAASISKVYEVKERCERGAERKDGSQMGISYQYSTANPHSHSTLVVPLTARPSSQSQGP